LGVVIGLGSNSNIVCVKNAHLHLQKIIKKVSGDLVDAEEDFQIRYQGFLTSKVRMMYL